MKHFFEQWLDEQTDNSINNEEVKDIFEESIKCYKIGAYRAAIVMAFNGFQIVIKNRIVNDKDKIISELSKINTDNKKLLCDFENNSLDENQREKIAYILKNNSVLLKSFNNSSFLDCSQRKKICQIINSNNGILNKLIKVLSKYKLNDENEWENELKEVLSGDRFFKIFSISTKNTIYKEWELWRSRRNTGAHGKSYKLISADVEAFYSWIQQSLNILYPFTHIDNILDRIDNFFDIMQTSINEPVYKLVSYISILENEPLKKVLDKLHNIYNNNADNRIFDIIKLLLNDINYKEEVFKFLFNNLKELNKSENKTDLFIINLLLYDNDIINNNLFVGNYKLYSNILNRIILCHDTINKEKEIELINIFILLIKNTVFAETIKEIINKQIFENSDIRGRIIVSFLYSDYVLQTDKNFDIILNNFSDEELFKIFLNKDFIHYIKGIYENDSYNTYDIILNFIIACSERNILNIDIVYNFNYDIIIELYSKREELSEHTQGILNEINNRYLNKLEYLDGIPNTFREINEIYQKIIWEYLNYEEVKFFTDILEKQNFIYNYYVTYEYFTEEICNMYEEKYKDINKDINFDIVKTGRKKAFEYCQKNSIYSYNNCGYIEPPNLSDE